MLIELKNKENFVLPKQVLDELNIKEGDKLEVVVKDGTIYIRQVSLLSKNKYEKIDNVININTIDKKKQTSKLSPNRNATLRSMLRQPVRAIIFVLLVAIATFGFVSRVIEHDILNREINRIAHFYRATGMLVPIDPQADTNVYSAIEMLNSSRFISSHDVRTITQGVLHDHHSGLRGFGTLGSSPFRQGTQMYDYKGLYPFDSFIIVEVEQAGIRTFNVLGEAVTAKRVIFRHSETLAGPVQFFGNRSFTISIGVDENNGSVLTGMQARGQYLIRATRQSNRCNTVAIFPLLEGLYFVDTTDTALLEHVWQSMENELQVVNENTSLMMLTGTTDMTTLPMAQNGMIERSLGRFITYDDYANAHHVMVVPSTMSALVGQTVSLTLRDMRTFPSGSNIPPYDHRIWNNIRTPGAENLWANMPAGYWVYIPHNYEGDWQSYPTYEIEVLVVGAYIVPPRFGLPRWQHINNSFQNIEAFVPASIVPEGFGIVAGHVVPGQYSFVLTSSRDITAFEAAYSDRLAEMGFMLQFQGNDSADFWQSILPIQNAIRLNLFMFACVMVIVLLLTVFIYLKQRYKEFAIMRALGTNDFGATCKVIVPVLIMWLPIVIIASFGAWFYAIGSVEDNIGVLAQIDLPDYLGDEYHRLNILQQLELEAKVVDDYIPLGFTFANLLVLCLGLIVAWVATVLIGTRFFATKSMILLLQTAQGGVSTKISKETGEVAPRRVKIADVFKIGATAVSFGGKIVSVCRHHARHICRMPVKYGMLFVLVLTFIIAIGWLDMTIIFTQNEIERVHNTTQITGELIDPDIVTDGFTSINNEIPTVVLMDLYGSEFVENFYYTTRLADMGIFPHIESLPDRFRFDGFDFGAHVPEWREPMLFAPVTPVVDMMLSFSCWDTFVHENSFSANFGMGFDSEFNVTFANGYSSEDFAVQSGRVQHVVVHESLLERDLMFYRGGITFFDGLVSTALLEQRLYLGGYAYIGVSWNMPDTRVKIIGTYTGGNPNSAYYMGHGQVLFPMHAFGRIPLSTLSFTMYQDKVMYKDAFAQDLTDTILANRIEHVTVVINDAELYAVVTPLEENLALLSMIYPVVRMFSFVLIAGLSFMLMLQQSRNAAILWVLGLARYKTRLSLVGEQFVICIFGVIVGVLVLYLLGLAIGLAWAVMLWCMLAALAGTFVGVMVITFRAPMELLQIRE